MTVRHEKLVVDEQGVARFPTLDYPHGFTTLAMGNMAANRELEGSDEERMARVAQRAEPAWRATGLDPKKRVHLLPEFGNNLCNIDPEDAGRTLTGAALTSAIPGYPLTVLPGDAFPVFLVSERVATLMIVGRQNPGIIPVAVTSWNDVRASDYRAYIGPGIHPHHYKRWGFPPKGRQWFYFGPQINLLGWIIQRLQQSGIGDIAVADACTYCSIDAGGNLLFFSQRRALKTGELNGRFLAAIALPNE